MHTQELVYDECAGATLPDGVESVQSVSPNH